MELSKGAKQLLERYQAWNQSLQPQGSIVNIVVDDVAAKVASFYEKIRGVVDWREEHLLRKTAVERIFKRRLLLNGNTADMAEPLLMELIRGGHFPNDRIPATNIERIQRVINKYVFLTSHNKAHAKPDKQAELEEWLFSVTACEIEEILANPLRERALIEFMSQDMEEYLQVRQRDQKKISDEDRKLQIFVGVQRALFKLDEPTISLHILERFYPSWNNPSESDLLSISQRISSAKSSIQTILNHPLADKFYQIIERKDTPYLLLGDILAEHPTNFLDIAGNPSALEGATMRSYQSRLEKLKARMKRTAFFSTLSVFLSKILVVLAIEIPVDTYITMEVNYRLLAWSIVIPPLFLLFLISSKKSSSQENVQKVLLEVARITYARDRKEIREISLPLDKKSLIGVIVVATYLSSFFLTFGAIFFVLRRLEFSILSIALFMLFLSLVSYAGMRIRQRSQELIVGEPKEGFLFSVFEFFVLPVTQVGKWFSGKIAKYNILTLLLNVFIEAPFQLFVEFIEQLRIFWKEKKGQIH